MRQHRQLVTAIDVGTTKVCTIVGRKSDAGGVQVLAHGVEPCSGLRKGNVVDVTATERAIRASVEQVQQKLGTRVLSAFVGVTGGHLTFQNLREDVDWINGKGVVTSDDLARVPVRMAEAHSEPGRKVIHALPIAYFVDGKQSVRNPVGMHTHHLEVETHVVTGSAAMIDNLLQAVQGAGLAVDELVLEPLASAESVLTPQERDKGVIIADIGGGTTDLVVFKNGSIVYTGVIPVAGYQFTNDIAFTYNTSYDAAEMVKLEYAHTEPDTVRPDEEVVLPVFGRNAEVRVSRREICQLTRERAQELARLLKLKLAEARPRVGDMSAMPLVLTGGTSNLPGLDRLVQRVLSIHVRVGVPNGNRDIPEELKAPAYATGVGILLWALERQPAPGASDRVHVAEDGHRGMFSRFVGQARRLLPKA